MVDQPRHAVFSTGLLIFDGGDDSSRDVRNGAQMTCFGPICDAKPELCRFEGKENVLVETALTESLCVVFSSLLKAQVMLNGPHDKSSRRR